MPILKNLKKEAKAKLSPKVKFTNELKVLSLASVLIVGLGIVRMFGYSHNKPVQKAKPFPAILNAYHEANLYAKGKRINLLPRLSSAYQWQCQKVVGMLPVAARIATRAGTISKIKPLGVKTITPDSIIVPVEIKYSDGMTRKFDQALVYENNDWKIGLVFTKGEGGF